MPEHSSDFSDRDGGVVHGVSVSAPDPRLPALVGPVTGGQAATARSSTRRLNHLPTVRLRGKCGPRAHQPPEPVSIDLPWLSDTIKSPVPRTERPCPVCLNHQRLVDTTALHALERYRMASKSVATPSEVTCRPPDG